MMGVRGILDVLLAQLQSRMRYGKIVRKEEGTISILLTSEDLKRMFAESVARRTPNLPTGDLMRMINVSIKENYIEVSIRLV